MKISTLLFLITAFCTPLHASGECNPKCAGASKTTQIIYINGPSSAGKSTLSKALQKELDEPFLHIGIDSMIEMMPAKINNWEGGPAPLGFSWKKLTDENGQPMYYIEIGPFAEKIIQTLKETVRTLANMGHYIIIDDISLGKCGVDLWREALQDYNVLWIGIKVPLDVLEERARSRPDRLIGSAKGIYYQVHQDVVYDLEFDTSKESLDSIVQKIKTQMNK